VFEIAHEIVAPRALTTVPPPPAVRVPETPTARQASPPGSPRVAVHGRGRVRGGSTGGPEKELGPKTPRARAQSMNSQSPFASRNAAAVTMAVAEDTSDAGTSEGGEVGRCARGPVKRTSSALRQQDIEKAARWYAEQTGVVAPPQTYPHDEMSPQELLAAAATTPHVAGAAGQNRSHRFHAKWKARGGAHKQLW